MNAFSFLLESRIERSFEGIRRSHCKGEIPRYIQLEISGSKLSKIESM